MGLGLRREVCSSSTLLQGKGKWDSQVTVFTSSASPACASAPVTREDKEKGS